MASALLEVTMQEKFSYSMAVWGLLGGGSMIVRPMRAFAVASEWVAVAPAFANLSAASLPGMPYVGRSLEMAEVIFRRLR